MRLVFNVDQTKECRGQLLTVWCRLSQQIGGATVVLATMDTLQTNRADRVTRRDAGEDRETGGNVGHLHTISFQRARDPRPGDTPVRTEAAAALARRWLVACVAD